MNIVLIWMRATWKSYYWRRIAKHFWLKFLDTDNLIELKAWMKIAEIVKISGWNRFREYEKEVLCDVKDLKNHIIATWWWLPCHHGNSEVLKELWKVIWLRAWSKFIASFLMNDKWKRPSLTWKDIVEELDELITERSPIYKDIADVVIDIDRVDKEEVLVKIIEKIWKFKI